VCWAISAFHQYFGVPQSSCTGKHLWMLAVLGGALIVAAAIWAIRRRRGGGVIDRKPVK